MKAKILTWATVLLTATPLHAQDLREVLNKLEEIKTATYEVRTQGWIPGDTTASTDRRTVYKEYENPMDTTLGVRFISYRETELRSAYDGTREATFYPENRGVIIDDFTWRDLPFRPIDAPFFCYAKSIVRYALTTSDPIRTEWEERENDCRFRLTVEGLVVEFFGRAHHIDPLNNPSPVSTYELWMDKRTLLPYKVRREMDHDIVEKTVSRVELNTLPNNDFTVFSLIPEDYEVRTVQEVQQRRQQQKAPMLDQPAPAWTLHDADGRAHSLSDLQGRVVLLNLTGIGCGPCALSVPFLNSLREEFGEEELSLVAIDTWLRQPHAIRAYTQQHSIGYLFLQGKESIAKNYHTGGAAPYFLLLDERRIIRRVFFGFSKDDSPALIRSAIKEMLGIK